MSLSKFNYSGYGSDWFVKSDVQDMHWMRSCLGFYASRKDVLSVLDWCADGWITVGGNGHHARIKIYSFDKLRRFLHE